MTTPDFFGSTYEQREREFQQRLMRILIEAIASVPVTFGPDALAAAGYFGLALKALGATDAQMAELQKRAVEQIERRYKP